MISSIIMINKSLLLLSPLFKYYFIDIFVIIMTI